MDRLMSQQVMSLKLPQSPYGKNHHLSPPPSPAPKDPLQVVPFCSETKVTSTSEVVSLCWDDELIMDAEVPSFIEQFPK